MPYILGTVQFFLAMMIVTVVAIERKTPAPLRRPPGYAGGDFQLISLYPAYLAKS